MSNVFLLIASNITSTTCVVGAIYMAIHDKQGWGWFLFVAAICTHSLSVKKGSSK